MISLQNWRSPKWIVIFPYLHTSGAMGSSSITELPEQLRLGESSNHTTKQPFQWRRKQCISPPSTAAFPAPSLLPSHNFLPLSPLPKTKADYLVMRHLKPHTRKARKKSPDSQKQLCPGTSSLSFQLQSLHFGLQETFSDYDYWKGFHEHFYIY